MLCVVYGLCACVYESCISQILHKDYDGRRGWVGWQEGSGLQCIDYTPLFGFTSLFATAGQLDCVWMKSRSVECFIRI